MTPRTKQKDIKVANCKHCHHPLIPLWNLDGSFGSWEHLVYCVDGVLCKQEDCNRPTFPPLKISFEEYEETTLYQKIFGED